MREDFNELNTNIEYCDPFDKKNNYLMRLEHLGRYMWAKDVIQKYKCNSVLDVACANGYGTKILSKACKKVVGIDNKKEYIDIAKNDYNANNIDYIQKDLDSENIEGMYDSIVCFETLEHLKYPNKFLNKLYNILNDNGIILLSIPNSKYEIIEKGKNKNQYHLNIFSYNQLLKMFNHYNFKVIKVLGQSMTNKILNGIGKTPIFSNNVLNDSINIAYPNDDDIDNTYSYIFILKKAK